MDTVQMVVAVLGNEEYGIPIMQVQEIIQLPPVTRIPAMPEFVEGVCNLRGRIIPLIDLRKRFRLTLQKTAEQTRAIVAGSGQSPVGLIADTVADVIRFPRESIGPLPEMAVQIDSEFLTGVCTRGRRMIILLNTEKLLTDLEKSVIKKCEDEETVSG
jgi:purine-binding chemotaxis protein CheW